MHPLLPPRSVRSAPASRDTPCRRAAAGTERDLERSSWRPGRAPLPGHECPTTRGSRGCPGGPKIPSAASSPWTAPVAPGTGVFTHRLSGGAEENTQRLGIERRRQRAELAEGALACLHGLDGSRGLHVAIADDVRLDDHGARVIGRVGVLDEGMVRLREACLVRCHRRRPRERRGPRGCSSGTGGRT